MSAKEHITMLDYLIMLAYLVALVGVAWWCTKMQNDAEDYLVSGRKMGFWPNLATHLGTQVGAGSTVGVAGVGFAVGISGMGYNICMAIAYLIFAVFIIPRIVKMKQITIGDILHLRFNQTARVVAGIVIALSYVAFTSSQFAASGKILKAVMGWDLTMSILIGAALIVAYTYFGGLWAVAYTDLVQWFVMMVGIVLIAFPMAMAKVGGWSGLQAALPAEHFSFANYGAWNLVGLAVATILGFLVTQDVYQRVWAAKDEKTAKNAMLWAALLFAVFAFVGSTLGMAAKVLYPTVAKEEALPTLITVLLPSGLTGLVLIAYLAAIMSTADSCLHAAATSMSVDIWNKGLGKAVDSQGLMRIARIVVLGIGVVCMVVAVALPEVFRLMLYAYTFMSAGLAIPVLAALFWKRATAVGAVASMFAGGISGILWEKFAKSEIPLEAVGAVVALVVVVVVSYLTAPPTTNQLDTIYKQGQG